MGLVGGSMEAFVSSMKTLQSNGPAGLVLRPPSESREANTARATRLDRFPRPLEGTPALAHHTRAHARTGSFSSAHVQEPPRGGRCGNPPDFHMRSHQAFICSSTAPSARRGSAPPHTPARYSDDSPDFVHGIGNQGTQRTMRMRGFLGTSLLEYPGISWWQAEKPA